VALFDAGQPCGIFGQEGWTTFASLAFLRETTHSVLSFGHIRLSFICAYAVKIDMQPGGGGFLRLLQGQLEPVAYTGVTRGFVDMQNGDRVSYLSSLLEIANVAHFGQEYTEATFQLVR